MMLDKAQLKPELRSKIYLAKHVIRSLREDKMLREMKRAEAGIYWVLTANQLEPITNVTFSQLVF